MGFVILILGLAVFFTVHLFMTFRDARANAIEKLGSGAYRVIFGAVSITGLALIVWGYGQYRAHEWVQIWTPPAFMRHVTIGLMLLAAIFFTAAFIPSHIKTRLHHPMLASVKTWAFAHLLSNGDLGSMILFGSFLAWGVYARVSAKSRRDPGVTAAPDGWLNDILVVAIGIVIFLAFGYAFHPMVIGVPVFGS
jgi:uncharacterized membrane protein